jgi:hypothetical protein
MSDQENFLSRWSRRKRDTANENAQPEKSAVTGPDKPAEPGPDVTPAVAGTTPAAASTPEFDLSKLPSIDSIGAKSDIRAFLQAGVPSVLRHAALRRAWSADPAIRDYIGPNENFWEGAGPGGVPGFGELDPNLDIKKLVAEVFGEAEREPGGATELVSSTEQSTRADVSSSAAPAASESGQGEPQPSAAPDADPLLQRDENVASHHDDPQQEAAASRPRRHGGAMPE